MSGILTSSIHAVFWVCLFVGGLALGVGLRRFARSRVTKASVASGSLFSVLGHVAIPVLVLLLTYVVVWLIGIIPHGFRYVRLPGTHLSAWLTFWWLVLTINLLEGVVAEICRLRGRPFPIPDLLTNILRALLILCAGLVVLSLRLGFNISPLLAATGLLTAVVGFALQGVLGNLLAGMSLHLVRSVVPSDWVRIGDVEGQIIQTNWRETRVRTTAGHIMVIPNSTVASEIIHNMSHPNTLRRHSVMIGASYSDAPGEVIAALREAALSVPDVLREPAPNPIIKEYLDFGINYELQFWTEQFYDRTRIDGQVKRMIWYKFKRCGIEIPFPMSDKLLNDFMEVVHNQRTKEPEDVELRARAEDLLRSDFCTTLCVDEGGRPLLSKEDLLELAPLLRRLRYTCGEIFFAQGEPGSTFYVLVRGRVKGSIEYVGAVPSHEFELGPGALFGEMSLMTGLPRTATISALDEVEVLEIDQGAFTRLLTIHENIPELLSRLVAERAERNAAAYERLKTVQASDIGEKVQRGSILQRFLSMLGAVPKG